MEILLANFSNYSLHGCKVKATSFLRHYIWQRWDRSFSLRDKWVQHVSIRRLSLWDACLKVHSQWPRSSVNAKWEAIAKDIWTLFGPKAKQCPGCTRLKAIAADAGRLAIISLLHSYPIFSSCAEVISVMATAEIFIFFLLFGLVTQVVLWAQFAPHFRDMNEILIISNIFICSVKACGLISSLLSCYWNQENYTKIHSDGYL